MTVSRAKGVPSSGRELLKLSKSEIARLGGEYIGIKWGGSHPAVEWRYKGHELRTFMAGSPSDHRAMVSHRAFIRREVRRIDALA